MKRNLDYIERINKIDQLEKTDILEVELELTGTCNLDCPLCTRSYVNGQHLVKKNERSAKEIIAQLDEYPNLRMCCLAGIVSEPVLHTEFLVIIDYLVSRDIAIELYSNASLRTSGWWATLAQKLSPRDKVFFTICGSTQEIHEKYRVGSSLEKILKNHEAFKASCPYDIDYIQHIRFEYNKDDFESNEMKKIIERFSHEANIDSLPYNERFGIIKEKNNNIRMLEGLAKTYRTISDNAKRKYEESKKKKGGCQMLCKSLEERFVAIDQYGKLSPCFLYRIYNKEKEFSLNYNEINQFTYNFCYECEAVTTELLEANGLERMG